jgi:hypothetical protein
MINNLKDEKQGSKMATGTQTQAVWALWIRDLVEMLETCLPEVKHQGELLKLWHAESLACGKLLHTTVHWKNKWALTLLLSTGPLSCTLARLLSAGWPGHHPTRLPPCRPARPLPCRLNRQLPTCWPAGTLAITCHRKAPTPPDTGSKPS